MPISCYEILLGLSQSLSDSEVENVYGRVSSPDKVLIVVITSNRGLCGAFNANVIKEARRVVSEKYFDQFKAGNLKVLTIGKKGYDYLQETAGKACFLIRTPCLMTLPLIMWLR